MAVESVNAALGGGFTDLARGFFRVFGLTKITALLGFTIAAVNVDRVRAFEAKRAEEGHRSRFRVKRRVGTWRQLRSRFESVPARSTGPPG